MRLIEIISNRFGPFETERFVVIGFARRVRVALDFDPQAAVVGLYPLGELVDEHLRVRRELGGVEGEVDFVVRKSNLVDELALHRFLRCGESALGLIVRRSGKVACLVGFGVYSLDLAAVPGNLVRIAADAFLIPFDGLAQRFDF